MRIALDLDDVLADFVPAFLEYHNAAYGTALSKEHVWSYRFGDVLGITQEETVKRVYEFAELPGSLDLPLVCGAQSGIAELSLQHELIIITGRQERLASQTHAWLTGNFPGSFTGVYFANHFSLDGRHACKGDICDELGIDAIIDDSYDNAQASLRDSRRVFLFDAPWNAHTIDPRIERVTNWEEIVEKILSA